MIYRAADTETVALEENQTAPPLVCLSAAGEDIAPGLYGYKDAINVFGPWLVDPNITIEGHNLGGFDLPVLMAHAPEIIPYVCEKVANDGFADTMLDQKILDLAFGCFRGKFEKDGSWTQHNYGLDDLTQRYFHYRQNKKGADSWRLRFGELREIPVQFWPVDAAKYAIGDAVDTRKVRAKILQQRDAFQKQSGFDLLKDSAAQMRAAIWLGLMQTWGIRIDVSKITILEQAILEDYREQEEVLRAPYPLEPCPAMVWVKPVRATRERAFVAGYAYQCGQYECKAHGLIRPDGRKDTKSAKDYMVKVMREAGRLPKITKTGLDKIRAAEALPVAVTVAQASAVSLVQGKNFRVVTEKEAGKLIDPLAPDAPLARADIVEYLQESYISLDKEACEDADDEVLDAYAALTKLKSVLSKDVPRMRTGRIHAAFNSLLRTGRTSCRGYNLQNPSRKGGVRECFIPDPGFVFAMIDLDGAELRGMAQVCLSLFGWSRLAEALNAGRDPHLMLGANLLGISYNEALARYSIDDQAVIDARQMAKVGNFGFAGGMGWKKFRIFAKASYKLFLSEEQVKWLKAKWLETWPEFTLYFRVHGDLVDFPGTAPWLDVDALGLPEDFGAMQPGAWFVEQSSGRLHAGLRYSQACNLRFQGLIATAFKASGWALCRSCYDPGIPGSGYTRSILFGSRPVNEIHDEHIVEVPESIAAECAEEMGRIVIGAVAPFLPGVPPTAKPYLTRCWSKAAFPVRVNGILLPWDGHKRSKGGGILDRNGLPLAA